MDPPTPPVPPVSPTRTASTTASVVTEIEGYIKSKDIEQLFKKILTRCFRVRPDDPIAFVFDYLVELYPHIAAAKGLNNGGIINGCDVNDCDGGVRMNNDRSVSVVVTHPDPEVTTYLNEHLSVASLFETIADKLGEDRPAKPLQHVVDLLALAGGDDDDDAARRGSDTSTDYENESDDAMTTTPLASAVGGMSINGDGGVRRTFTPPQ